ncbi:glycosyl transferase family protein [compost metagenome]
MQGVHAVLESQQPGTASEVPGLPAEIDVATTAHYTRRVLAGELPIPPAIERQVEHILRLADQTVSETSP